MARKKIETMAAVEEVAIEIPQDLDEEFFVPEDDGSAVYWDGTRTVFDPEKVTKYTIELSDGTKLPNLVLNGNNYVAQYPVSKEDIEKNCTTIKITSKDSVEVLEHCYLVALQKHGEENWIIFGQYTPRQLSELKTKSDIEYIAMMTDVEL